MNRFVIVRRGGWANLDELNKAAARSKEVGEKQMKDQVRWIRSYVLKEKDGRIGTICIYDATSPEAIRKHAECAGLPCDDVTPVADTVVICPDMK